MSNQHEFIKEEKCMQNQIEKMKIGDDALFWPQPILHLDKPLEEDGHNIIIMKLCKMISHYYL
jgi:hypothetical protein